MGSGAVRATIHVDGGEAYVNDRVRELGELGADVAGVEV